MDGFPCLPFFKKIHKAFSRNMVHVMIVVLSLLAAVAVTFAQPAGVSAISLLGRNKSPEQQCLDRQSGRPGGVCKNTHPDKWCTELICANRRGDIPLEEKTGRALDGTWCGDGKMCSNGSCVDDTQSSGNTFVPHFEYNCKSLESSEDVSIEINI